MLLLHCTWDKFGELMAESGARSLGLFDELMSFFATMNMYSSHKMQLSDTRQFQDFLQLFTGKSKTRETVTGNANFTMSRTSFSLFGMTQPYAAMPVIQDHSNNAKGFTSRILWFFPEPVFAKFEESMLTTEEKDVALKFKEDLENFLAELYISGEGTFQIEEDGKRKAVSVDRAEFNLTNDAVTVFKEIHDEWEMEICKKNPHDALLGGIYPHGKSHVLRLAAPIQLLLDEFHQEDTTEPVDMSSQNQAGETSIASAELEVDTSNQQEDDEPSTTSEDPDNTDEEAENTSLPSRKEEVSAKALHISHSLVNTCLSQMCTLNDKTHVLNGNQQSDNEDAQISSQVATTVPDGLNKLLVAVLSTPGTVVSFSILVKKGVFRRHQVQNVSNKELMMKVVDELSLLHFGSVENFTIPSNNSKVYFFNKRKPPTDRNEAMVFATRLAEIGMSLPRFIEAYEMADDDSEKHRKDYADRQEAEKNGTPRKRPRVHEQNN